MAADAPTLADRIDAYRERLGPTAGFPWIIDATLDLVFDIEGGYVEVWTPTEVDGEIGYVNVGAVLGPAGEPTAFITAETFPAVHDDVILCAFHNGAHLNYGVWDGQVYDWRDQATFVSAVRVMAAAVLRGDEPPTPGPPLRWWRDKTQVFRVGEGRCTEVEF